MSATVGNHFQMVLSPFVAAALSLVLALARAAHAGAGDVAGEVVSVSSVGVPVWLTSTIVTIRSLDARLSPISGHGIIGYE
jgi:hypothetical protein